MGLQCELMDEFAVLVQFIMAFIALSSLIIKRQGETPKRPVNIWLFDTSKQALSAGLVHFANVFLSYFSGKENTGNPCIWYFLNILLDTTVGVGILYLFLKGLHSIASFYKISDIESGIYGNPPRLSAWFKQFILFITAWFFVKLIVVLGIEAMPFLVNFASWVLSPLERNAKLQVIVVMLIFPLIMNIVQAWLIDMVIKGKHAIPRNDSEEDTELVHDEDEEQTLSKSTSFTTGNIRGLRTKPNGYEIIKDHDEPLN